MDLHKVIGTGLFSFRLVSDREYALSATKMPLEDAKFLFG